MTPDARDAALAERERIARLAEQCDATYERQWKRASFADLIRSGATRPLWYPERPPDPLSAA